MDRGCACGPDSHADDCEGGSLLASIDVARVTCANEAAPQMCHRVLKPLAERRDHAPDRTLWSHAGDRDLLLTLPFTSACKIKSICISGPAGMQPGRARLFINRDDIDLDLAADIPATQELDLPLDVSADAWHPLRAARFGAVTTLSIYLSDVAGGSHGADNCACVYFIGLKGTASGLRRGIVTAVYEARAMPSDHPVTDSKSFSSAIQ